VLPQHKVAPALAGAAASLDKAIKKDLLAAGIAQRSTADELKQASSVFVEVTAAQFRRAETYKEE
jgi:hypothetical protein